MGLDVSAGSSESAIGVSDCNLWGLHDDIWLRISREREREREGGRGGGVMRVEGRLFRVGVRKTVGHRKDEVRSDRRGVAADEVSGVG